MRVLIAIIILLSICLLGAWGSTFIYSQLYKGAFLFGTGQIAASLAITYLVIR